MHRCGWRLRFRSILGLRDGAKRCDWEGARRLLKSRRRPMRFATNQNRRVYVCATCIGGSATRSTCGIKSLALAAAAPRRSGFGARDPVARRRRDPARAQRLHGRADYPPPDRRRSGAAAQRDRSVAEGARRRRPKRRLDAAVDAAVGLTSDERQIAMRNPRDASARRPVGRGQEKGRRRAGRPARMVDPHRAVSKPSAATIL